MANPTSGSGHKSPEPFDEFGEIVRLSISDLERGDLQGIRARFQIGESTIDSEVLGQMCRRFIDALRHASNSDWIEAFQAISDAAPFVDAIGQENLSRLAALLRAYIGGVSNFHLSRNDAAEWWLNELLRIADEAPIELPEFFILKAEGLITQAVLQARLAMMRGNAPEAEQAVADATRKARSLMEGVERFGMKNVTPQIAAMYMPAEFSSVVCFEEIKRLKIRSAKRWAKAASDGLNSIDQELLDKCAPTVQSIIRGTFKLTAALNGLCDVAGTLLQTRVPKHKELLVSIERVEDDLGRARKYYLDAGVQGRNACVTVAEVGRYIEGLLELSRPSFRSYVPDAGIIFFGMFVAGCLFLQFSNVASGRSSFVYLVLIFLVSLIGAFSYGALRFLPIIKAFSDLVKQRK